MGGLGLRGARRAALALCLLAALQGGAQAADALQAIPSLDLPRYLGRWYEIAKFPNRFQKKCLSDTSAQYSVLPQGGLRVRNQCRLQDGSLEVADGVARQPDPTTATKLQVRFAPAWLSALPWVWGDYWVVDLDEGYTLAAVSEPQREYLWILARSPTVDPAAYAALLQRLSAMGLAVDRLETSRHTAP